LVLLKAVATGDADFEVLSEFQRCLTIEFGNLDVRGELVDLLLRSGWEGEFRPNIL